MKDKQSSISRETSLNKKAHRQNKPHRARRFDGKCSHCGGDKPNKHYAYCKDCKNAYSREWRKSRPLTSKQRMKDNARSYAHVYLKRGKLKKLNCEHCGDPKSEMHHPDYTKPLFIVWLCRGCHVKVHSPYVDGKAPCSICRGKRSDSRQAFCRSCQADYMRGWRKKQRAELLELRALAAKMYGKN